MPLIGPGMWSGRAENSRKVDTVPSPAHVFLEEFTGLHCSYCPQAHAIANNLTYLYPEQVHVMAVHTGGLAIPSGNDPDMRTSYGDSLFRWSGEGGMPSGDLNRTVYPESMRGHYTLPRSEWMNVARRLLQSEMPAPVNLYARAQIRAKDVTNIYIDVEAYAVAPAPGPLFLHVALTENFVPGSQAGGGLVSYLHRHVLRDFATGLYGDTIKPETFPKGAYLSRAYTYTLPEQFGNREPNLANLACLVFVTDSTGAVLNSLEAEVESPVKASLDYLQINLHRLGKTYGGAAYDVYVVNPSDDTVRSLSFAFDLNGDKREYVLNGLAVLPKTETVVRLESDFPAESLKKVNIYSLRLTAANGKPVASNVIQSNFSEPVALPSGLEAVRIEFTGDAFGSENRVCLSDASGKPLYEAGPFVDGTAASCRSDLLPMEADVIYTLEVTDAFRDGVDGGRIRVVNALDSVLYDSSIGAYGHSVAFRRPAVETALESGGSRSFAARLYPNPARSYVEVRLQGWAAGRAELSLYDLQGRLMLRRDLNLPADGKWTETVSVADYPQGIYMVRVVQAQRNELLKLVIRN